MCCELEQCSPSTLSIGLPHAVEEDDIYEGMFIAKGSIVIPNIWYAEPLLCTMETLILFSQAHSSRSDHVPKPGCLYA